MITVQEFFDTETFTLTYCVWNNDTLDAVVIDSVLDYDVLASKITTSSVEKLVRFISDKKLKLHYVLETHAHADHLSGAQEIKKHIPTCKIGIGEHIKKVQSTFAKIFNLNIESDGRQFDELFKNGQVVNAGSLSFKVLSTPGHTPACVSYLIEDALFTGDALFMPDSGVGRCDFPEGSAETLFDSVTSQLFTLEEKIRVYTGHDYQPNNRPLLFQSTIGEEKKNNIHLKATTTKNEFVKFRTERDKTLKAPRLLFPSLQVNIDAGRLPLPENNAVRYLKIPLL